MQPLVKIPYTDIRGYTPFELLYLHRRGDVVEPEDGLIGIGSGGPYALAAARALISFDLPIEEIARRAMKIAADICIYTNENVVIESLSGS